MLLILHSVQRILPLHNCSSNIFNLTPLCVRVPESHFLLCKVSGTINGCLHFLLVGTLECSLTVFWISELPIPNDADIRKCTNCNLKIPYRLCKAFWPCRAEEWNRGLGLCCVYYFALSSCSSLACRDSLKLKKRLFFDLPWYMPSVSLFNLLTDLQIANKQISKQQQLVKGKHLKIMRVQV